MAKLKAHRVADPNRPVVLYAADSYANPAAGLGFGATSLSEGAEYPMTRLTMQYMMLLSLYRGSGILKRIINLPVEDAIAHWYKIDSQLAPEQLDALKKLEKKTKIKRGIEFGLKWARLFGGAGALIMIDGHGDILDQPLDLKTIEVDSFKGLYVVDRWSGLYPSMTNVDDINDPDFGLPEYYEVRASETATDNVRVHHSRILRFVGDELPYWESLVEQAWGASVIETIFDELRQYDDAKHNIGRLLYQANVWIQKSPDLAQMLGTNQYQSGRLYETLKAQNILMSSFSTRVIDADDSLENKPYAFTGLDQVLTQFQQALCSVTGFPMTKLFGISPGGMNATGESDTDNYYTLLENMQENKIEPHLDRLLPIMCMSEFGAVPDDLGVSFNPVRIPDGKEKADIATAKTTAVTSTYDNGLLSRKTALKELRQMSEETGLFTNITDEEIEAADDEPQQMGEGGEDPMAALMGGDPNMTPEGGPVPPTGLPDAQAEPPETAAPTGIKARFAALREKLWG